MELYGHLRSILCEEDGRRVYFKSTLTYQDSSEVRFRKVARSVRNWMERSSPPEVWRATEVRLEWKMK